MAREGIVIWDEGEERHTADRLAAEGRACYWCRYEDRWRKPGADAIPLREHAGRWWCEPCDRWLVNDVLSEEFGYPNFVAESGAGCRTWSPIAQETCGAPVVSNFGHWHWHCAEHAGVEYERYVGRPCGDCGIALLPSMQAGAGDEAWATYLPWLDGDRAFHLRCLTPLLQREQAEMVAYWGEQSQEEGA